MKQPKHLWGFTLLECLVTILILLILISVSIAGFSSIREKFRMNNAVNNLVHALHLARQKSRLTGTVVSLCKSRSGQQCENETDWHQGWLVFGNADADDPPVIDLGETVYAVFKPSDSIKISANRAAFHIRPFGRRSTNGTLRFCSALQAIPWRSVVVSYTGKPRTVSPGLIDLCADGA